MPSYQDKWRLKLQQDLGPEGWDDVIERAESEGLFPNWQRTWDPGGSAEFYLRSGLEVLCGDRQHPYARRFLEYAVRVAQRACHETERWLPEGDWGNPEGRPGRVRGTLLRAKALSEALLGNGELDATLLAEAARLILSESREARGSKFWTDVDQSKCLSAVQLLLISGDINGAKDVFKWRKSFKPTQHYHDWLRAFTVAISDDGSPVDARMRNHFDGFFDLVRDPDWVFPRGSKSGFNIIEDYDVLRLQLALIKQRVILGAPVSGHWNDVIDLIAQ